MTWFISNFSPSSDDAVFSMGPAPLSPARDFFFFSPPPFACRKHLLTWSGNFPLPTHFTRLSLEASAQKNSPFLRLAPFSEFPSRLLSRPESNSHDQRASSVCSVTRDSVVPFFFSLAISQRSFFLLPSYDFCETAACRLLCARRRRLHLQREFSPPLSFNFSLLTSRRTPISIPLAERSSPLQTF